MDFTERKFYSIIVLYWQGAIIYEIKRNGERYYDGIHKQVLEDVNALCEEKPHQEIRKRGNVKTHREDRH